MNNETSFASVSYGFAFLVATFGILISAIVGLIGFPWVLAATLDGHWQAVAALAVWSALTGVQVWLLVHAVKHRDTDKLSLAILYLALSLLPAAAFIYVISL